MMFLQDEILKCCTISEDNKYSVYDLKKLNVESPRKFASALIDALWNNDVKTWFIIKGETFNIAPKRLIKVILPGSSKFGSKVSEDLYKELENYKLKYKFEEQIKNVGRPPANWAVIFIFGALTGYLLEKHGIREEERDRLASLTDIVFNYIKINQDEA
ncbi:MAG: hypothetical protein ACP5OC_08975 [Thermoplasmata archaeon]